MENAESVMLATAPEASALIQGIVKEELSRDMGKAASETLAIVLYLGSIARSRIDWIRGVNSTFILRNLMIRGLVERITNPSDERSFYIVPRLIFWDIWVSPAWKTFPIMKWCAPRSLGLKMRMPDMQ